jgi:hypothetical protein
MTILNILPKTTKVELGLPVDRGYRSAMSSQLLKTLKNRLGRLDDGVI